MIFLLFYYLAVSVCCAWAGLLGLRIFARFRPAAQVKASGSMIMVLLSGLILLTIGGEWLVVFFPLQPWMLIPLLGLLHLLAGTGPAKISSAAAAWFSCRARRNPSVLFITALLSFLLLVLVFNAGPSRMDDTESYHIPAVKWMAEYGTVPGLANLHVRFGLNSAWFVAIALFTHSTSAFNNYLSLNGVLCVWFSFYLVERIFSFTDRSGPSYNPAHAMGVAAVLFIVACNWYFLRRSAASCSYDFIGTVVVFVLFMETANEQKPTLEWLLWPLFLFTVRITHFPFLLLTMLFLFRHHSTTSTRSILALCLVAGVVIMPFFIRNWILSGYLFFPFTLADILPGNWKADPLLAGKLREYARLFNRVNPMFQPMSWTRSLTGFSWVSSWWKYLFPEDKVTVTAGVAGYAVFWIRYRKQNSAFPVFHAVMTLAIISWFLIAPDPRFIQGVWLTGVMAGFTTLKIQPSSQWRRLSIACFLSSVMISGYAISKLIRAPECRNFLFPRSLPVPPLKQVTIGQLTLNVPERVLNNWNPRCYDAALPCLYLPDPRLRARGAGLADGFRLDSAGQTGSPSFTGEYLAN